MMRLTFACALLGLIMVFGAEARTIALSENDVNTIQDILRNAVVLEDPLSEKSGCSCINYDCGCCLNLDIPKIRIKDHSCVNVSYLPDEYGFRLTLTINKFALINTTVSAKNPPPVCVGIPHLAKEASICLDFYNLDVKNRTISGCIKLEVMFLHITIFHQNFGCFHIPLHKKDSLEDARLVLEGIDSSKLLKIAENN